MVVNNRHFSNVNRIPGIQTPSTKGTVNSQSKGGFAKILEEKVNKSDELKFSKHAEMRLRIRNINLSPEQKEKIITGVKKANEKGVKDSLVMVDNIAFVINVKNRTVITAVAKDELKENVFTNIDGAVFT